MLIDPREVSLLTGIEAAEPRTAAATLLESMAPDAVVLVRQREEGSWLIRARDRQVFLPPAPGQETVDTGVAADAYTGAFVAELARLGHIEAAARHATVAASITTLPSDPTHSPTGPSRAELMIALDRVSSD